MSYVLKKEHRFAFEIAGTLADRNPDWVDAQIFAAQIQGEIVGEETEVLKRISRIRSSYSLSSMQEAVLAAVEAEVQNRQIRQD